MYSWLYIPPNVPDYVPIHNPLTTNVCVIAPFFEKKRHVDSALAWEAVAVELIKNGLPAAEGSTDIAREAGEDVKTRNT